MIREHQKNISVDVNEDKQEVYIHWLRQAASRPTVKEKLYVHAWEVAQTAALIRTDKTVSQIEPHVVVGQVNSLYNSLLHRRLSAPDALWIANLQVCKIYGLAFYAGKIREKLEVIFQP